MTSSPADPVVLDIDEHLAALRAEGAQLELDELDDPMRAARDVAAWHARADQRRRRSVEIESQVRDLEEWGALAITHAGAISNYTRVARPIASAYAQAIRVRTYRDDIRPGQRKPRDDVRTWLRAVQDLAAAVPDDENTRRVLARELEAWFRLRDGIASAEHCHLSASSPLPSPELGNDGGLPPWLRWGIHRLDGDVHRD